MPNSHRVNADMYVTLKVHVLSDQGDQVPGDPVFQGAPVAVSSEFCAQNNFKAAG